MINFLCYIGFFAMLGILVKYFITIHPEILHRVNAANVIGYLLAIFAITFIRVMLDA